MASITECQWFNVQWNRALHFREVDVLGAVVHMRSLFFSIRNWTINFESFAELPGKLISEMLLKTRFSKDV